GIDLVFPFQKTPTNVIARMLDYSPVGLAKSGVKGIQLARAITKNTMTEAQQRAFSETFGRGALGSGLISLGAYLYYKGYMTGFAEDDPTRRERDRAAGRAPGAIRVGDIWVPLAGFAPGGNLLAIGATLAREVGQEREGSALGAVAQVAASAI